MDDIIAEEWKQIKREIAQQNYVLGKMTAEERAEARAGNLSKYMEIWENAYS